MQFEDDYSAHGIYNELPEMFRELTRAVIGAAIEVHRALGPGLPEEAYQKALEVEFAERTIPFEAQKPVTIIYKGVVVARGKVDFLVAGCLIVEIKSVEALIQVHWLQTRSYMRILKQPLGLLMNFNVPLLKDGVKRVIDTDRTGE